MNHIVTILEWKVGLQKVKLTKAIMAYGLNYGLKQAKKLTDRVVNNEIVEITCSSSKDASAFLERAREINAIAESNNHAVRV